MTITVLSHTQTAAGTTGGVSPNISTLGASTIICAISAYTALGATTAPVDSQNNTWTALAAVITSEATLQFWYVDAPSTSATHNFTCVYPTNSYSVMEIIAVSGTANPSFDTQVYSVGGSGTAVQAGSITPSQNNCLVLSSACANLGGGASNPTVDSGFTVTDGTPYTAGQNEGGILAYLIQTAAAAVNPTWTYGGGVNSLGAANASFLPGAVAAAQNPYVEPPFLAWQTVDPLPVLPVHSPQGQGPTTNGPYAPKWQPTVLQAWVPPDPLPTLTAKLAQGFNLPYAPKWQPVVLQAWTPPDPLPTLANKLNQGQGPTTNTPFYQPWVPTVLQAWTPPDPLPTLTNKLPQGFVIPGASYAPKWLPVVLQAWTPPDPLPTLTNKLAQGQGPTTNGAYTRPWLSAVLTAWQAPDPLPTLPVHTPQGAPPGFTPYAPAWFPTVAAAWAAPDPLPTLLPKLGQGSPPIYVPYAPKWLSAVGTAWVPPDPPPTLPVKFTPGAGPTTDVYAPVWQQTVLTAWWTPPDPLPTLPVKFTLGVPPPSPYQGYGNAWQQTIVNAWPQPDWRPPALQPFTTGTPARVNTVVWSLYQECPHFYGNPKEWWPELIPNSEYADFTYDATNDIPPGDMIVGLTLSVAPSGPGEAVPSRLALTAPGLVTAWITGGYPGRVYTYQLVLTTLQIRQLPILIGQKCQQVLPQPYPALPPINPGFGSTVTWTA